MDWAEKTYPALFPTSGRIDGSLEPYTYRYYPGSLNYLGVSTGTPNDVAIYLIGPATGGQLQRIGPLTDYTCTVLPQSCLLVPERSSISAQLVEGTSQQIGLNVQLPRYAGSFSASVARDADTWLAATAAADGSVKLLLTATTLAAPATRSGTVELVYQASDRPTLRVTLPVTMTVAGGIVGPASVTRTLDANATTAQLGGSWTLARGDGQAGTWTASVSAPWVKLSASSGALPSTLAYALDASAIATLENFADHVATITLATPGLRSTTATITLRKRQPFVAAAMPYGIPSGSTSRVSVGGVGFDQYASLAAALKVEGLSISKVTRVSDRLLTFETTPQAGGSYVLTLDKALVPASGPVKVHVAPPNTYQSTTTPHTGDASVYVWVLDPVRQAIYATSRHGNALYKYQFANGTWTSSSSLSVPQAAGMGLRPDGQLLVGSFGTTLTFVNPTTMQATSTLTTPFKLSGGVWSLYGATVDGRMWLPDQYPSDRLNYLDPLDGRTLRQIPSALDLQHALTYESSADGTSMLIGPVTNKEPAGLSQLYRAVDASISRPMGETVLSYDASISADGKKVLKYTGRLYNDQFALLGSVNSSDVPDYSALTNALTPDGSKIVVLSFYYGTEDRPENLLEVYSTTEYKPGTTWFKLLATIPLHQPSARCAPPHTFDTCSPWGALLITSDSKTAFWVGNQRIQAFPLP